MTNTAGTTTETWKAIAGYEGVYEVSDLGRVRSLMARQGHKAGQVLNGYISRGHRYVRLYLKGKKMAPRLVARLVMEAFKPRPDSDDLVAWHDDEDLTNNTAINLVWRTRAFALSHAAATAVIPWARGRRATLKESDVAAICALHKQGLTQQAIGNAYRITQGYVSLLIRRAKAAS